MPEKPTYEELETTIHELRKSLSYSEQEVDWHRQLIDATESVIYAKNLNGQYILINKAFEALSGFDRGDVIGKTDFELFPENVAANSVSNDKKVIETKTSIKIEEFGPVQGENHSFISHKYPLISSNGGVEGILGISIDITKQKLAEKTIFEKEKEIKIKQKKIEKSEALFRSLFNNMVSGSAIYEVQNDGSKGSDYIIRAFNKTSLKIEGKTIDQVLGKSLFDLRPTIDEYGLIPVMKEVWETGKASHFPSTIYVDDNFSNYYENHIFKLPTGEIVTIYNDVTDLKNAEIASKQAEKLFLETSETLKDAQSYAKIGSWWYDPATQMATWTEEMFHIFGLDPQPEALSYADHQKIIYPDDWECFDTAVSRAVNEGVGYNLELRIIRPDGELRYINARCEAEKNKSGEVKRLIGTTQDITDRKLAEIDLKNSEEKYRDLFENMAQGAFYQSNDGKLFNVNSAALDMFGLTYDQFIGKTSKDSQWKVIHEDGTDFPAEEHPSMVSLSTGKECRDVVAGIYNNKKNGYIWASINAIPQFKDGEEKPYQVFVTMHDITARKESEDLLRIQHDLAVELSHIENLEEGIQISLNSAINASKMDCGAIYLCDRDSEDLILQFHKGLSDEFVNATSVYKKESSNIDIVMKGQPVYTNHKNLDIQLTNSEKNENLKALAIIPIRYQNQILGCLNVASKSEETIPEPSRIILETITNLFGQSFLQLKTKTDLQISEERYQDLYDNAPDMYMSICAKTAKILDCNQTISNELGYSKEELLGRTVFSLYMPESMKYAKNVLYPQFIKSGAVNAGELQLKRKNGSSLYVSLNATAIRDDKGNIVSSRSVWRDITPQIELKQRLIQSQKMESIGTLAGGIAHDFNNILSSILGFSELALTGVDQGSELEDDIQEIRTAGLRAKELVKQILTFARQSDEAVKPIQVNTIAKEVLKLIKSSIPATIQTHENINSDSFILGSPTQIHQVLMNLCTNASQAMEENGGILKVSLDDISIEKPDEISDLKPGEYIKIKVADTGIGIPSQHIHTIFEPYFTTKPFGEGTGMGLAVVHGIIESYGGKIIVKSEAGNGSSFSVYLPISKKRRVHTHYENRELPSGNENILFVDDEYPIAKMGSKILGQMGYSVTTRTSSVEALGLFKEKPDMFDLVITDMTMPNMTGDIMAVELMKIRPDIPVILCTGYSKKISEESAAEIGIKAFIYKPIVNEDLAKTVRNVLDEAKT